MGLNEFRWTTFRVQNTQIASESYTTGLLDFELTAESNFHFKIHLYCLPRTYKSWIVGKLVVKENSRVNPNYEVR